MNTRHEVQQFLSALRARLTPEQAGMTVFGGQRRVPGLRREEVAQLAGVSTAYCTRMERGDLSGVSESVLFALVRALQLDEAGTTHLFDLARTATGPRRPPRTKPEARLPPRTAQLLDTMGDVPATALSRGTERINHPVVGEITVGYDVLAVSSTPGLTVTTYLTEPGSPSADALAMLRSWTADASSTVGSTSSHH